jgi:hypothetical protein
VHPPQSLNIFFNNYLYVKLDCALNLYELIDTYQQMLDFSPTASMTIMGEKLGMNSQIGQPVCYGSGRDPFFSGAVDSFNSIDDCESLSRMETALRKRTSDVRGLTCESYVSCVSDFPCTVCICDVPPLSKDD